MQNIFEFLWGEKNMLKKSLLLALSLLLVFSLSAFAGEGSDTVGGGKLLPQLRYGYSATDWVTNDATLFADWDVNAHNYYAQVNWGILNNVDLIALVGGRSVSSESDFDLIPGVLNMGLKTDTVPMFLWGLGVKGTFYRADNGLYIGGGALFTHSFSRDYSLKLYFNGVLLGESPSMYERSVYRLTPELHVGWNIKKIGLTPYIGADYTWSRAVSEIEGDGETEYEMQNPFMMFAGVDYFLMDKIYINVEGRTNFVDGWGIETGVGYLFDICPKPAPAPAPAPVIEPKLEPMSKN
jgi:hypothetical protein